MKKMLAFLTIAVLAAGCASTSDIEGLQGQIDSMKPQVEAAAADAASAKAAATRAEAHASAAETAAVRAASVASDVSAKLDRLFKKTQLK